MPSEPRDSKRKAADDVEVSTEGKVHKADDGQVRAGTVGEQPAGPSGWGIGDVARAHAQQRGGVKSEDDAPVIGLPLKKNPAPVERDVPNPTKSDRSDDSSSDRKMRLVWSQELHNRFLNALSHLGLKKAVPKNILGLMNVEGMTRENVASHLQKYRLYLKKNGGYTAKDKISSDRLQELHEENVQRMASQEAMQQNVSFMDPQGMGGFGNFPPHFQAEIPHMPSEEIEYKPQLIVDGIPIGDPPPQPVVTSAMFTNPIPKPDMSPAVQEVDGGHFNPNKWKYPAFPGDTEQQEHSGIGKGEEEEYHHHHHHHGHLPFNAAHEEKSDDIFEDKSVDHTAQPSSGTGNDDDDGDELLVNNNNNNSLHDA